MKLVCIFLFNFFKIIISVNQDETSVLGLKADVGINYLFFEADLGAGLGVEDAVKILYSFLPDIFL